MKSATASLVLIFGPRITLLDHKVTIGLDFVPGFWSYLSLSFPVSATPANYHPKTAPQVGPTGVAVASPVRQARVMLQLTHRV